MMKGERRATTTRGERVNDDDRWFGLLCIGVWFWFALYRGFLFFIFDKHLCIGVCFAFALYRLYWGLVFSASDVTMGLISDSLYWFFLFIFF